jgi:hypothetical protein
MREPYDYHNGKVVDGIEGGIHFDDGSFINEEHLLSEIPSTILRTKLLKVVTQDDGVEYLYFGHSYSDGRDPLVAAIVEATGSDLSS